MTRRDLNLIIPMMAMSRAAGERVTLPSEIFRFDDLPVHQSGQNRTRAMLQGATHTGCNIEIHQTELSPGDAPHPPHHHAHEEMILIREGTMEVTISGKSAVLGPGSAAYVASNEEHGWRNVGTTRAHYFILALGTDQA